MHAEGCHADPVKMLIFKELITLASSRVNTRQCHSETKWCHYGASFKPWRLAIFKHSNPVPHCHYFSGIAHNHVRNKSTAWCFPPNTVHYTSPLQMFWWRSWSTPVLNKVLKIQIVDDKRIPQLLISHSLIQRKSFKSRR